MRELQQELVDLDNQVQLNDFHDIFEQNTNTGYSVSDHIFENENIDLNFPENK